MACGTTFRRGGPLAHGVRVPQSVPLPGIRSGAGSRVLRRRERDAVGGSGDGLTAVDEGGSSVGEGGAVWSTAYYSLYKIRPERQL